MGNVTLPAPLLVVGGVLAVLAGYLVGAVAGPDRPTTVTGQVESYDRPTQRLCLVGGDVSEQQGADAEGRLCGQWKRSAGSATPRVGQDFRFVSVRTAQPPGVGSGGSGAAGGRILIYGDVVG